MKLREVAIGLKNIVLGGGVASLPMARRPRDWAVAATEVLAVWDAILDRKGIEARNVHEVFAPDRPIETRLWNPPMGPIAGRTVDMLALCQLCSILYPKTVFEIGTLHGETALHFVMNGADQVYTLDLPPDNLGSSLAVTSSDVAHKEDYSAARMVFHDTPWERRGQIRQLFGDSATFDFSPYHGWMDLFFVDGAHSYAYVRSDTINALRCLRPGGVIAWHDFGRRGVNGVSRFLRELQTNNLVKIYAIPGGSMAFSQMLSPGPVADWLEQR